MTETAETIPTPAAEPRRLTRSRDGRWLGGVCTGLGRYFELNPMIYRIGFVGPVARGRHRDPALRRRVARHARRGRRGLDRGRRAQEPSRPAVAARRRRAPRLRRAPRAVVGARLAEPRQPLGRRCADRRRDRLVADRRPAGPPRGTACTAGRRLAARAARSRVRGRSGRSRLDCSSAGSGSSRSSTWRPARTSTGGSCSRARLSSSAASSRQERRRTGASARSSRSGSWCSRSSPSRSSCGCRSSPASATGSRIPSRSPRSARSYEQGIGNLNLELQRRRFPVGQTDVKTTLGIGDLVVTVPKGVTVKVDAHAGQAR